MKSPATDMAVVLSDSDVGLSLGTDLFVSSMPDSPNDLVSLYDRSGVSPLGQPTLQYFRPSLQIMIRNDKFSDGYAIAKTVFDKLHGLTERTVNSTRYILVWASSDIMFLGRDEENRCLFSLNFEIHRSPA